MKRKFFRGILTLALIVALCVSSVYTAAASQMTDVPIGSSNQVTMVGEVEPTIMSVSMPTYVPFHIGRSVEGDNKVISPRITVTNNSSVPVNLDVIYTSVDLSRLSGTTWSNGPNVGSNQIAIGLQAESVTNQMPTSLAQTKWLVANAAQDINILSIGAFDSSTMYVVGTLGSTVPENNTFTVMPTFIVRQA